MFWLNSYQRNCLLVHLSLEPAHNKYGLCTTVSTVSELMKMTQRSKAWFVSPSMPRRQLDVPAVTYDCGARNDTSLNHSKRCLSGAYHQQVWGNRSPRFLLDTNKDICYRVQPAATTLSPTEAALIYFPKFAKLPPPTPPNPYRPINQTQKPVWKNPNEDRFSFAAELWQVRDSLVGNMEFCLTLMGQRMAPHFEWEHRQWQKANLNIKIHPPQLAGSVCKRTTSWFQRAFKITKSAFDWWVHHEGDRRRTWQGPNLKSAVSWHTGMIMLGLYYSENVYYRL